MTSVPIQPPVRDAWGDQAPAGSLVDPDIANPGYVAAGWPLSQQPPARQYWNFVLNYVMNGVRYLSKSGVNRWNAQETYAKGDMCIAPPAAPAQGPLPDPYTFVVSLIDNNVNQQPVLNNVAFNSATQSDSVWAAVNLSTTFEFNQALAVQHSIYLSNYAETTTLGGMVIKTGQQVCSPSGTLVEFPDAFPQFCVSVQVTDQGTLQSGDVVGACGVQAYSANNFTASNSLGRNTMWVAYGY